MDALVKKFKLNPRWLGNLAYLVIALLQRTLSVCVNAHPDYDPRQPALFAFWHGKQLLPVLQLMSHQTLRAALVSPSTDGEILATWLAHLGYEVIRGSSRDQNIRSLVQIIKKLKAGYSVGFGVDGPVGPIYRVKPGMTYIAQKCQCPIIVVGSYFQRKWIVEKAWDKYQIPKPFSKATFYFSEPLWVPPQADLQHYNRLLEKKLHYAEQRAASLLKGGLGDPAAKA